MLKIKQVLLLFFFLRYNQSKSVAPRPGGAGQHYLDASRISNVWSTRNMFFSITNTKKKSIDVEILCCLETYIRLLDEFFVCKETPLKPSHLNKDGECSFEVEQSHYACMHLCLCLFPTKITYTFTLLYFELRVSVPCGSLYRVIE